MAQYLEWAILYDWLGVFYHTSVLENMGVFKNSDDRESFYFGYTLLSVIPVSVGLIMTLINLEWLQIIVVPKLYLLEYAAELVK